VGDTARTRLGALRPSALAVFAFGFKLAEIFRTALGNGLAASSPERLRLLDSSLVFSCC
jgi:hypothetical protein